MNRPEEDVFSHRLVARLLCWVRIACSRRRRKRAQSAGDVAIPNYARAQNYQTLKQSTYDRTEAIRILVRLHPAAHSKCFSHRDRASSRTSGSRSLAKSAHHLKELVLRMHWEGNAKPSVEVPIGDFFGLNLGEYFVYQSAFLNCSSVKALNCYFAMPFRRSARITVTNESEFACQSVLFEHRLSTGSHAARRRAVFPRAIPAGDS